MTDDYQPVLGFFGLEPEILEDPNPQVFEPADIGLEGPPPDYKQNSPARIPLCDGYKLGGAVEMNRAREIIRHLIAQGRIPAHSDEWTDGRDVHTVLIGWKPERVVLVLNVYWTDIIQLERVAVLQAVK